jgi:hypothetical protein
MTVRAGLPFRVSAPPCFRDGFSRSATEDEDDDEDDDEEEDDTERVPNFGL